MKNPIQPHIEFLTGLRRTVKIKRNCRFLQTDALTCAVRELLGRIQHFDRSFEVPEMFIMAHSETGSRWSVPVGPWELHPALVHFPLALLLSGVVLDLYAWWRGRPGQLRAVAGLLVAGVVTGLVAALAGVLAFFTVPAHTAAAHRLMY